MLHIRGIPNFTTEAELIQLVAPFGEVSKVFVMSQKNQAFVQMASVESAAAVLQNLELGTPSIRSKEVYFQYSSRQSISASTTTPPQGMGAMGGGGGLIGGGEENSILLISITNVTLPVTMDNVLAVCKPYGQVLKIITFTKGVDFQALVQMANQEQAAQARMFLDAKDMFQGCCHLRVTFSKRTNLVVKQNNHKSRDFTMNGGMPDQNSFQDFNEGGMGMPLGGVGGGGSPVVLASRMNAEMINPDMLFTLFGVFGDVTRVKILYSKRDSALIQFRDPQQAAHAVQYLDGCVLHGSAISVAASKAMDVKMPRGSEEDGQELTKDFTGSDLHRFKRKSFVNLKNVNGPSQVLHVANLHDECTEEELITAFAQNYMVQGVEFFKSTRKMAYVCMQSVEEAVATLIAMHNAPLGGYNVRVSFSHKAAFTSTAA